MTTLLYMHSSSLEHDTGLGHPEQAGRIRAISTRLEREERKGGLFGVERREPPRAERSALERVHSARYVDAILNSVPRQGHVRVDPDTIMSPGTGEAALRSAGGAVAAVDAILEGAARNAFCALRPPGHHAEPERSMGFCFFNNVAVGAMHAIAAHGLERVSIVDFDVHHGNGTEAAFLAEPRVQYCSTHQWPLYPGTGHRSERGIGNIVNRPLPAGTDSKTWRDVVSEDILKAIDAFEPQLILISAGFDAHAADPLAMLELHEDDFWWITRELIRLADRHGQGRVVSVLEGGYDLAALTASVWSHLEALRGL